MLNLSFHLLKQQMSQIPKNPDRNLAVNPD